ncbi:MAG: rod shape-determining protein MreC, partial [Eggerthellaceae bacterium]|nr:rod shape-determining protein MreC [Eggerthellaceae bacterium]
MDSVLLITVSMRVGNVGVLAGIRSGVQTVAAPMQRVSTVIGRPFRASGGDNASSLTDEEIEAIVKENEQLRTLVAELEEYRQQDQRLAALLTLSDTYALESVSGRVVSTTDGWSRTATINVGSGSGVKVGQGVISSCGLYGQVVSVTANSAQVRLITDATSSVSATIQGSRDRGIVSGSYDGNLTLDYISVDSTVGEGDVILTSGDGGTYPRGIVIGTVKSVEPDSSRLYYRITVEPIMSIETCKEVLVLTGNEDSTKSIVDIEYLKSIIASVSTYEES